MSALQHRNDAARRSGFTLVETVISSVVVALLMSAMVSTMLIAARAVESTHSSEVSQTGDAMDQITTDLSLAQNFTARELNAVTVVVPDRDGDGLSETIRYAWSGNTGDALTRQYNDGTVVVLADNVYRFDLSYLLKTVAP